MEEQFSPDQLLRDLNSLDRKLVELKTRYEQYFVGVERREPLKLRKEVQALVSRYASTVIQNTGLKFRYQGLVARHNSFQAYFNRVLKEMEEGNYKRDVFKSNLHNQQRQEAEKTKPAAASAKKAAATSPYDQLYNQLVTAKQKAGESIQGMDAAKFSNTIKQQAVAIKARYKCKRVVFRVTVEDGKAKIKAVPKDD